LAKHVITISITLVVTVVRVVEGGCFVGVALEA